VLDQEAGERPSFAFYYPNSMWLDGDWVKNLILFFDGVALLVPDYMRGRPFLQDPAIATGLDQHHLLKIIEPETAVDKAATVALATAMTDIICSGALDPLAKQRTKFAELSRSRMGYEGDAGLAEMIHEELQKRGLAKPSGDGVSIPMHPMVRSLILVLLAQILRPRGEEYGVELFPATDQPKLQRALVELLSLPTLRSAGHVVTLDMQTVGLDLSAVPLDDILEFRDKHGLEHRRYMRNLRRFVDEIASLQDEEQARRLRDRTSEIADAAASLRSVHESLAKRGALAGKVLGMGCSIAGALWPDSGIGLLGGLFSGASGAAGALEPKLAPEAAAYSYMFEAQRHLN
jgi:hypothetical protein